MCMKLEERMTTKTVDRIHKEGFWFDYINDDVAEHWRDYDYEAMVLLECERIPLQTACKAAGNFAESGKKNHLQRTSPNTFLRITFVSGKYTEDTVYNEGNAGGRTAHCYGEK